VSALLQTSALTAFYGDFQALFGIDAELHAGERVAIIGANGAGKSTFLASLAGAIGAKRGEIVFDGARIDACDAATVARKGIALVPEGRRLFPSLSVEENIRMGTFARRSGSWNLDRVYGLFPALREKRAARATTLSGGQQQMAAIARALMANPRVLLCDEVSLGLSPAVVRDIYAALPAISAEGVAVVLVEQDVELARTATDRVYCFTHGRVTLQGPSATLTRDAISEAYFGVRA
jgi:branched-chain amino acid transport system ATP-binding protein